VIQYVLKMGTSAKRKMIRPARKRPGLVNNTFQLCLDVESIPVVERMNNSLNTGFSRESLNHYVKSRISATVRKKKMNVVGDAIGSSPRNIPTSDEASAKRPPMQGG